VIKSAPTDERRHEPAEGLYWNESWYFDFSRADGTGGYVRLGLYPNQQVAWYWAYIVSPEHGLVVVLDHEIPLPRRDALEARRTALAHTVAEAEAEAARLTAQKERLSGVSEAMEEFYGHRIGAEARPRMGSRDTRLRLPVSRRDLGPLTTSTPGSCGEILLERMAFEGRGRTGPLVG
jgi:hypothetical protein